MLCYESKDGKPEFSAIIIASIISRNEVTTSADEDRSAGWKLLIFIYVHLRLSAPAMSADNSQVGVAICTPS